MSGERKPRKRRKWEPAALMLLLLALGIWLVNGPWVHNIHPRPGATTLDLQIGNEKGILEVYRPAPGAEPEFRVLLRNGFESPAMHAVEFKAAYGEDTYDHALRVGSNWFFRRLRITSWMGVAWVCLGLAGQVVFAGRMFVQWFASERRGQSVVPPAFWWMSLLGGVMVFAYFVWRQDIVGVLGQCSGIVIYARNIRLIGKHKRRAARQAAEAAAASEKRGAYVRS